LARQGQTERARRVLKRLQELAAARYVPPTSLGLIHAGLNLETAVWRPELGREPALAR
jgi:hypothetical protein